MRFTHHRRLHLLLLPRHHQRGWRRLKRQRQMPAVQGISFFAIGVDFSPRRDLTSGEQKKERRKDEKISLQLKTKLTFFYAHFLLLARKIVLCDSKRNAVVLCGGRLQVTMASTNAIEFIVTRSLVVSPKWLIIINYAIKLRKFEGLRLLMIVCWLMKRSQIGRLTVFFSGESFNCVLCLGASTCEFFVYGSLDWWS